MPRSVAISIGEVEAVYLHPFTDASILACHTVVVASAPAIKFKNIKEKYLDSQNGACEWSYGNEHGIGHLHCSPAMAHQDCHHLDGHQAIS